MANICERVGAEATAVMAGIGLDTRIGSRFLNPGVGWGGSCFGKDIHALLHTAHEYGYDSKLLRASIEVNAAQRLMVIQKLQEKLFILKGRTIGLLGLAFKPDTDDIRDAPSLHIAERLLQMDARVKAYDPVAIEACRQQRPDLKIRLCDSPEELAEDCDALVVVTEWQQFRTLDLVRLGSLMHTRILVDGRNLFLPEEALAAGFDYTGIGRSSRPRAAGANGPAGAAAAAETER
jgi:UDPglucose 6-dehydrogenase